MRMLRIMMRRPSVFGIWPYLFFKYWRDVVEESQAAARMLDPILPSYLRPWFTIVHFLPAMKARHLCNSLAAITNLSTACTSLRLLCCRQMKRWWVQIRLAVNNEAVNGTYTWIVFLFQILSDWRTVSEDASGRRQLGKRVHVNVL